tara:strand:- start:150 stop:428 length:279 start_codon:yes stop_codon:yes gene_type:complete
MTPNQIYKKDKISGISFKDWLQKEKDKGNFIIEDETSTKDNEDKFLNLTENKNAVSTTTQMKYNNIIGIVAISILIFGIYQISKRTMVEVDE